MEKKALDKNDLFLAFRQGRKEALDELIAEEKSLLYDYLVRMTGDRSRSEVAVFEATELMPKQIGKYASYAECRQYLFKSARESCQDIWNSDTTLLTEDVRVFKNDNRLRTKIREFSVVLQALAGPLRECVLLLHRYGFNIPDAAVIMGEDEDRIHSYETQTIKALLAGVTDSPQETIMLLGRLSYFDWQMVTGQTQDIYDLVSEVRGRSREKALKLVLVMLLLAVIAGSIWVYSRFY